MTSEVYISTLRLNGECIGLNSLHYKHLLRLLFLFPVEEETAVQRANKTDNNRDSGQSASNWRRDCWSTVARGADDIPKYFSDAVVAGTGTHEFFTRGGYKTTPRRYLTPSPRPAKVPAPP